MPGFLYYLPGKTLVTREDVGPLGLAYAFADDGISAVGLTQGRGPDGATGGAVFASPACVESGRVGYHAAQQTWREIPRPPTSDPRPPVWVGYYKSERPTPELLARPKQITGYWLTLADDREWLVPVARALRIVGEGDELALRWHCTLPHKLSLAADGNWVAAGVRPVFSALWEIAEQWADVHAGRDQYAARFDGPGAIDAAVLALQSNYRIGRAEADLLGLLDEDLVNEILGRLIDNPTFDQFVKKKLERASAMTSLPADGSPSPAGPADSTPITPLP